MNDALILSLTADNDPIVFYLQGDGADIRIENPEHSILFEIAPALAVVVPDTTDYLLYYTLSRG